MKDLKKEYWQKVLILSVLGFIGVLSALPLIPKLIQISGQEVPIPMPVLYVVSTIQSSVLVLGMVFLGAWASSKVHLKTPLIDSYLGRSLGEFNFRNILVPAFIGGLLGGLLIMACYRLFLPALPSEFIANAEVLNPPVYTKLLYGGITEEILIRFGLMSFFSWAMYRITQKDGTAVRTHNYVVAILISSLIFGIGHLPAASLVSPVVTSSLLVYIILGNSIFGLVAGFLFWKRGLEAAIVAHMVAHLVVILGEKIT